MKFIPYSRFYIASKESPNDVVHILDKNVGEKPFLGLNSPKEFNGTVNGNEFQIQKNISYRNSFLPIIEGRIKSTKDGAIIDIKMRLNSFVFCFICIWFFGVGIGCILVLSNIDEFSRESLIPLGMLVFGFALVNGGFWFEASKQKKRLIELLKKT